ncbi:DUF2252 family protein [Dyella jejuensis]|uniref:DUF2252 family protein n=1 Tax=Dyella jejuensis TaxID=1432009 RepID=A0ABW8JLF4_9GAMM
MAKKHAVPPRLRQQRLTALRNLKMAKSAHAYVRGNVVQFYDWLEQAGRVLPQGPEIWICGDCHVSNMGPVSDVDGNVDIQIRDLDQTVIGNPAHDLIRLGVSLATSARGSDLPGVVTAQMQEELIAGYELALSPSGHARVERPATIRVVMKRALKRRWKHLAEERLQDTTPDIPLGRKFWPITANEQQELQALAASDAMRNLVTQLIHRKVDAPIQLLDAKYWVKGCSSLGYLRYAVLLSVGRADKGKPDLCLIDIKEALRAAAPHAKGSPMPRSNADRIVQGAKHLAPHLGERMLAAKIQGKSVFVRELRPQDLKIDLDRLTSREAMGIARYLGHLVGRAHASQLDRKQRQQWLRDLKLQRPASIDAPSWLWRSVVELIQAHEGGYLDHCRGFALEQAQQQD